MHSPQHAHREEERGQATPIAQPGLWTNPNSVSLSYFPNAPSPLMVSGFGDIFKTDESQLPFSVLGDYASPHAQERKWGVCESPTQTQGESCLVTSVCALGWGFN